MLQPGQSAGLCTFWPTVTRLMNVGVFSYIAVMVVNGNQTAVPAHPTALYYCPAVGGNYRCAGRSANIQSVVKPSPAVAVTGIYAATSCNRPHETACSHNGSFGKGLCASGNYLLPRLFYNRFRQYFPADFPAVFQCQEVNDLLRPFLLSCIILAALVQGSIVFIGSFKFYGFFTSTSSVTATPTKGFGTTKQSRHRHQSVTSVRKGFQTGLNYFSAMDQRVSPRNQVNFACCAVFQNLRVSSALYSFSLLAVQDALQRYRLSKPTDNLFSASQT